MLRKPCVAILILGVPLAACNTITSAPTGPAPTPAPASGAGTVPPGYTDPFPIGGGFGIRQLTILDDSGDWAAALADADAEPVLDDDAQARLTSNGLYIARVDVGVVDSLVAGFGEPIVDVSGWHGEAHQWRDIARAPIERAAVAVDGRVRAFESGTFELMMRGWPVQMENGRFMYMELLPRFETPRTLDFGELLNRERRATPGTDGFPALGLATLLQPGWAYIITGVESSEKPETAPTPSGGLLGPDAPAPVTIGELLLVRQAAPAGRDVLIVFPSLDGSTTAHSVATGRSSR